MIYVCDNAVVNCPFTPGKNNRIHWSLSDPATVESDEAKLHAFRDVRDGLVVNFKQFISQESAAKTVNYTKAYHPVLCADNSACSHMAEAFLRYHGPDAFDALCLQRWSGAEGHEPVYGEGDCREGL